MTFQGFIFDFNGVLLWDGELQEISWNMFAESFRGFPLSPEELDVHAHGRSIDYTLSYLAGRPLDQKEIHQLGEKKEQIYRKLCLDQGQGFGLSPGAETLLDNLLRRKISMTIATASGQTNLNFFTQHLQLERWFDLSKIVYNDGKTPGKPAPDFYQLAAKKINVPPDRCVVIEDSISGIQAASAAGIGHIIALSPLEKQGRFRTLPEIDDLIENLGQVPVERLLPI